MFDRSELFYLICVSSDFNYFHQSHQKSQLAGYVVLRKNISLASWCTKYQAQY